MKGRIIIITISVIGLFSCNKEDEQILNPSCQDELIIDQDLYDQTINNIYVDSLRIEGDCLHFNLNATGCDGNSWVAKLIDSGNIAESFPAQRFLRLSLENNEACAAQIFKTFSFDLTPLQTEEPKFILNIEGWNEGLLYEY